MVRFYVVIFAFLASTVFVSVCFSEEGKKYLPPGDEITLMVESVSKNRPPSLVKAVSFHALPDYITLENILGLDFKKVLSDSDKEKEDEDEDTTVLLGAFPSLGLFYYIRKEF